MWLKQSKMLSIVLVIVAKQRPVMLFVGSIHVQTLGVKMFNRICSYHMLRSKVLDVAIFRI